MERYGAFPAWLHYLHFHEIKSWVGLVDGVADRLHHRRGMRGGGSAGRIADGQDLVDWQAIQFYRAEWLLAATAAFVAGILLKKPADRDSDAE